MRRDENTETEKEFNNEIERLATEMEEKFKNTLEAVQEIEEKTIRAKVESKAKDKGKGGPKNIVDAMDKVLTALFEKKLSTTAMKKAQPALDYLNERLGLTDMQNIFLSMLCDCGGRLDYARFARFLGCHRIKLITHDSELQQMVRMGIVNRLPCDGGEDDYIVRSDAMDAYQKNKKYVRESIENLSTDQFIAALRRIMFRRENDASTYEGMVDDVKELMSLNRNLPLVVELDKLHLEEEYLMVLLGVMYYYLEYNALIDLSSALKYVFKNDRRLVSRQLKTEKHPLYALNLIEKGCNAGFMAEAEFGLTQKAKDTLLPGIVVEATEKVDPRKGLILHEAVKAKSLYYNNKEKTDIDRLAEMLQEDNLKGIQQRLEERGMRKGFACLFYGAPGTGKTETVMQLARMTGRDIFKVNISDIRDKFVGESEKNVKNIFATYRRYCKNCEKLPILLFNEADAIISKRSGSIDGDNGAVNRMDNAMQNIILEEIENLEGILIATTNLKENMDDAYARRFIYKVEFDKPTAEARKGIWKAMLPSLNDKDAGDLAKDYELSGGEIENVTRKQTVDQILYGTDVDVEKLRSFCESELEGKSKKAKAKMPLQKVVGFGKIA